MFAQIGSERLKMKLSIPPRLFVIAAIAGIVFCTFKYELSHGFVVSPKLLSIVDIGSTQVNYFAKNPTSSSFNYVLPSSSSSSSSVAAASSLFSSPATTDGETNGPPAPVIDGKRILPVKIMLAGLKGHQIPAVYAVLNSDYKKAQGGEWEACQHVSVSRDLAKTLQEHVNDYGIGTVCYVRALSFITPNDNAMESIARDWRKEVFQVKGKTNFDPILAAMDLDDYLDDDDDDDYDDDDDDFEMMAGAMSTARGTGIDEPSSAIIGSSSESITSSSSNVISPFNQQTSNDYSSTVDDNQALPFTKENVDRVLDEIRPYLISDGGNVSVQRVDEKTKNVYLLLEGACGSCPSSTVTMQMGVERVLKENFADLGEVIQVEGDEVDGDPKELTFQTVQNEVDRIKPAIIAMGGVVKVIDVDSIGTVKLNFRGANKIRQGLELALLDIDFVKHIEFVTD